MDTSNKVREYTKKLSEIGQEHIFDFYSELSEADQEAFLRQIETIDFSEVKSQIDRLVLANEKDADFHWDALKPADYIPLPENVVILLCGSKRKLQVRKLSRRVV